MKKKKKWIAVAILAVILVLVSIFWYYSYVTQDQVTERNAAIVKAKQSGGLVSTTQTWKSVWDQVYWVVQGKNAQNENIMVWVPFQKVEGQPNVPVTDNSGVHTELLKNGVDEQKMTAMIQQQLPGADIVSLQPSVFNGQYVWQLFYDDGSHHYYTFYRFSDGGSVGVKYTLPNY
ncbi:cell wall elongation regulator TseB-like domain-containing protein [Paenibacillus sp. 23TSA30-6]|uniref:cell wall elongation regulator TseB-like domain-containing protein n=1 Tax=Paenibacillus sp. 23TSA30-6 TaxID=2546104 RepID=UPI00178789C5|nr:DUF5590 domain-containing protein [Paenibacillus sp. 23TSA30-6]MBE0335842.1 hypothetical protein [Paenibacillus sp. 23TSA30-6]